MKARISTIETPELRGVILLSLQIQNNLLQANKSRGSVELALQMNQQVQVGVAKEGELPSAPVVVVTLHLQARDKETPNEVVRLQVDAKFSAAFNSDERVSYEDWMAYTSSSLARNVALQAAVVCQRLFREQIRLVGIPPEKIAFAKLGPFEKPPLEAAIRSEAHRPRKSETAIAASMVTRRAKRK